MREGDYDPDDEDLDEDGEVDVEWYPMPPGLTDAEED